MLPITLKKENAELLVLHNEKLQKETQFIEANNEDKAAIAVEIESIQTRITDLNKVVENQLAAWKQQHGSVFEIGVNDKKAYLKKLSKESLSLALTYLNKDNVKFAESVFENNAIGGDVEMIDDTDYVPGIIEECLNIVMTARSYYTKH